MNKYLSVLSTTMDNNNLILIDIDTWMMFEYNIETFELKMLDACFVIPENCLCWGIKMLSYENFYFVILRNSRRILGFDKNKNKGICFGEEYEILTDDDVLFLYAYISNNKIIMLPYYCEDKIMEFDLKTHHYSEKYSVYEYFSKRGIDVSKKTVLDYTETEDTVWFCIENTDIVCCLQKNEDKINYMHINCPEKLSKVSGDEEGIILLTKNAGKVYLKTDDEFECVNLELYEKDVNDYWDTIDMQRYCNKLFYFCSIKRKIYVYYGDGRLKTIIKYPDNYRWLYEIRLDNDKYHYNKYAIAGKVCYFAPFGTNGILKLDMETEKLEVIDTVVTGSDFMRRDIIQGFILGESENRLLSDYIDCIKRGTCYDVR